MATPAHDTYAAINQWGKIQIICWVGQNLWFEHQINLDAGRLKVVLPDYTTSPKREIYAVFQPNRFQSTRLRLFVDVLVSAAKGLPW